MHFSISSTFSVCILNRFIMPYTVYLNDYFLIMIFRVFFQTNKSCQTFYTHCIRVVYCSEQCRNIKLNNCFTLCKKSYNFQTPTNFTLFISKSINQLSVFHKMSLHQMAYPLSDNCAC